MRIKLSSEESALMDRVDGYCRDELTQPEMAEREGLTLSGFRSKLQNCGFAITSHTTRSLVRARTSESYTELKAKGQLEVAPAISEAVAA